MIGLEINKYPICSWIQKILLCLFIIVPFQFQLLKLIFAILCIGISAFQNRLYISKKCFYWNIIFFLYNAVYISFGLIHSNLGVSHYILVYLLWPILFMFLSGTFSIDTLTTIPKVLYFSVWFIIIIGLVAFLKFNIFEELDGEFFLYKATIRPGYPFIAISSPEVTGFIFWYFFFFSYSIVRNKSFNFQNAIFCILGIVYIFATSRRIIFVSFAICLLLIYLLSNRLDLLQKKNVLKRLKKTVFLSCILLIFSAFMLLKYDLITENSYTEFLDKTGEASDEARFSQTESLLDGWMENPIFGAGTGVNASVIRSKIPGGYELTYLAKLFETGLIGFSIYIILWWLLFYWTIEKLHSTKINKDYLLATICGMTIFMISNATNPYLGAFDYMWFMYTPFVFINNDRPTYGKSYRYSYGDL